MYKTTIKTETELLDQKEFHDFIEAILYYNETIYQHLDEEGKWIHTLMADDEIFLEKRVGLSW